MRKLLILLTLCACTSQQTATVTSKSWVRSVEIEAYELVEETHTSLPQEHVELIDKEDVCETEVDIETGAVSVDCETEYTYTIYRWIHDRTLRTQGVDPTKPFWPKFSIADASKERAANYEDDRIVHFRAENKSFDFDAPEEAYKDLVRGEQYQIGVRLGSVVEVHEITD